MAVIFAGIPLISLYFIFLIFYKRPVPAESFYAWRRAFLSATVIWAFILVAITEILSAFSAVTFHGVLSAWILTGCASVFAYSKLRRKTPGPAPVERIPFNKDEIALLLPVAIIIIATGIVAVITPPNTWDSMTYHMSRIYHWIQNGNINYYPTHIIRQLNYTPGAELFVLHFQILTGGDYCANLVQWFCMLGSIIAVSLIAGEFGLDRLGQIFAALICATIPMGIMQASTNQNDWVASFWTVCFAYYVLLILKGNVRYPMVLAAGASLGLALLAKGTGYLFALPFLVWLAVAGTFKLRRRIWAVILIIVSLALLINSGYYLRNLDLFHTVFVKLSYANEAMDPKLFLSNVIRNISMHFGTPWQLINLLIVKAILFIHNLLGVNIDDPRITDDPYFAVVFSNSDFHTGNPLHLLLVGAALIILFTAGRMKKQPLLYFYLAAVAAGFSLLCFHIKWILCNSRYHLTIFVLLAPFVAKALYQAWPGSRNKIIAAVSALLVVCAIPIMIYNDTKPLIGENSILAYQRISQYFYLNQDLEEPYRRAAEYLSARGFRRIGLILDGDGWEYPLIMLLAEGSTVPMRIEHVNVTNESARKGLEHPFKEFVPDAIVSFAPPSAPQDKIICKGLVYQRQIGDNSWGVFVKIRPGV